MIKTYVLNMEKDVQKRATIESQLEQQKDLDVTIFKAIEGRKLTEQELNEWVDMSAMQKRYNNFATLPAIGCALSHWNIYKMIATYQEPYALILEDDALLSTNLANQIKQIEHLLLTNDPVIILLTPEFVYSLSDKTTSFENYSIYNLDNGIMNSGYLVNLAAATILKEKLFPIKYLADQWNEILNFGIKILGVVPHLISYPDGLGEIGTSQHNNYQNSYLQKIPHYLAGIKGKMYVFLFIYMIGHRISTKNW